MGNQVADNDAKQNHVADKNTKQNTLIKKIKIGINPFSLILLMVVVVIAYCFIFLRQKSMRSTVSSILKEEKTVSQLSVLYVPYGGMIVKTDDKGNEIQRIVYDESSVEYAIEFNAIRINEDSDEKLLTITVPKIKVTNPRVPLTRIRTIPSNNSGKGDEFNQLQSECVNDMINQFENNQDMKILAKETVGNTIKNFIEPVVKGMDGSYRIEVVVEE